MELKPHLDIDKLGVFPCFKLTNVELKQVQNTQDTTETRTFAIGGCGSSTQSAPPKGQIGNLNAKEYGEAITLEGGRRGT